MRVTFLKEGLLKGAIPNKRYKIYQWHTIYNYFDFVVCFFKTKELYEILFFLKKKSTNALYDYSLMSFILRPHLWTDLIKFEKPSKYMAYFWQVLRSQNHDKL